MPRPVLIYDGQCRFCTNTAKRIAARWPRESAATAVAWQDLGPEGLGRFDLSEADVATAAWWIDADGNKARAHLAVAAALREAKGWRGAVGLLIRFPIVRPIAAAVYVLVARNRSHLPVPRLPFRDVTTTSWTTGSIEVVEDPDWLSGMPRLVVRAPAVLPRPARWALSYQGMPLRTGAVAAGEQVSVERLPELEPWMDSRALRLQSETQLQATCLRPCPPRTRAERKADEEHPGLVDQIEVPVRGNHRVVGRWPVQDGESERPCAVVVYQDWSELLRERRQRMRGRTGSGGKRH